MEDYSREPCPQRIVDDCGGAFAMGCIGGGIFQAMKGFRNAPQGIGRRFAGSVTAVKTKSPGIAGNFAAWGVIFSIVDCSLVYMRQKEDPWNSIVSGAVTGGVLSARKGVAAMAVSAIIGATMLSLIEGVGILSTRLSADHFRNAAPQTVESSPDFAFADVRQANASA
ncbi:hypothetical protein KR200_002620 [Drosophila serrata]|nr:hypothetical protein KR200_002620 [Drosophila serrata]